MDFLVVAAAAGAGYLAKHWQNISREKGETFPGISSADDITNKSALPSSVPQICDQAHHFRNLALKKLQDQPDSRTSENNLDGRVGETLSADSPDTKERVTTSGKLNHGFAMNHGDGSFLSPAGPSSFVDHDYMQRALHGGIWVNVSDNSESFCRGMGPFRGSRRGKSSLRSRRSNLQFLKPLSSLESCMIAQLYKERADMEESAFSTPPSSPTLRPFVVTDGSQMISRPSGDFYSLKLKNEREKHQTEFLSETSKDVIGIPPLPVVESVEGSGDQKLKKWDNRIAELTKSYGKLSNMELNSERSPSEAIFLCVGISIGIISSSVANNREMTKLKEHLKQTENLVQDLQEEIEMKDSLTVNELVNEDSLLQHLFETSAENKKPLSLNRLSGIDVRVHGGEALDTQKTAENLDSILKIEAELEAELERLELSMTGSTLQGRLSDDYELNPDLVGELAKGDLRSDSICQRPDSDHSSTDEPPHSPKWAVSPHELCLRLHEVAQSRLEERIAELEAELERRQKRVESLESGRQMSISWRGIFSHGEESSSSGQDSPVTIEAQQPSLSPLVMNLSGDALDAYNEASEELKNIHKSKKQEIDFEAQRDTAQEVRIHTGIHEEEMFLQSQNGSGNSSVPFFVGGVIDDELDIRCGPYEDEVKGDGDGDDEEDDQDDGMAMLIKQIVERTRQGSPAVLHAHKAMVSMDIASMDESVR